MCIHSFLRIRRQTMRDQEVFYTVPDYKGYPTRVRASEVEAFLEAQEELKKNPPTPEDLEATLADSERAMEELWAELGITPPEEDLF
jgi:hypothetical protein